MSDVTSATPARIELAAFGLGSGSHRENESEQAGSDSLGTNRDASPSPTNSPQQEPSPSAVIASMLALDLEDVPHGQSIYFIESAGLVKVGQSSDPKRRILGLINSTGAAVRILAVAPGDWPREQHLHSLLAASRHHSEWFHPTNELVAWIHEARADSKKWHALPDAGEAVAPEPLPMSPKRQKQLDELREQLRILEEADDVADRARAQFLRERGVDHMGRPLRRDVRRKAAAS